MFFVCTDKMFGVVMCGGGISKYHIAQPLGIWCVQCSIFGCNLVFEVAP